MDKYFYTKNYKWIKQMKYIKENSDIINDAFNKILLNDWKEKNGQFFTDIYGNGDELMTMAKTPDQATAIENALKKQLKQNGSKNIQPNEQTRSNIKDEILDMCRNINSMVEQIFTELGDSKDRDLKNISQMVKSGDHSEQTLKIKDYLKKKKKILNGLLNDINNSQTQIKKFEKSLTNNELIEIENNKDYKKYLKNVETKDNIEKWIKYYQDLEGEALEKIKQDELNVDDQKNIKKAFDNSELSKISKIEFLKKDDGKISFYVTELNINDYFTEVKFVKDTNGISNYLKYQLKTFFDENPLIADSSEEEMTKYFNNVYNRIDSLLKDVVKKVTSDKWYEYIKFPKENMITEAINHLDDGLVNYISNMKCLYLYNELKQRTGQSIPSEIIKALPKEEQNEAKNMMIKMGINLKDDANNIKKNLKDEEKEVKSIIDIIKTFLLLNQQVLNYFNYYIDMGKGKNGYNKMGTIQSYFPESEIEDGLNGMVNGYEYESKDFDNIWFINFHFYDFKKYNIAYDIMNIMILKKYFEIRVRTIKAPGNTSMYVIYLVSKDSSEKPFICIITSYVVMGIMRSIFKGK